MDYIKDPKEIERISFEIISKNIGHKIFKEKELSILKRVIHTTADFEYENILKISDYAVEAGLKALKEGCKIITDTKMAEAGINKKALLSTGAKVKTYISDKETIKLAKNEGITRSMASMILASEDKSVKIFAIGNAPTALFKLCELIESGKAKPELIIGVPVGFVGAKESKEEVKKLNIPYIITEGRKGGSNIAAAIVNALLYLL